MVCGEAGRMKEAKTDGQGEVEPGFLIFDAFGLGWVDRVLLIGIGR